MDLRNLEAHASKIPTMGGLTIASFLRQIAKDAPPGTSIVEVGSWLGFGAAQLALGNLERDVPLPMHIYDRWQASPAEVDKAWMKTQIQLEVGQDTLPITKNFLAPFHVPIHYHKGQIANANWSHGLVSIYVDDAAKDPLTFDHVLRTFGPHWIPGVTIVVLMDFNFWRKSGKNLHKFQMKFINRFSKYFQQLPDELLNGHSGSAFRYVNPLDFSLLPNPRIWKFRTKARAALRSLR